MENFDIFFCLSIFVDSLRFFSSLTFSSLILVMSGNTNSDPKLIAFVSIGNATWKNWSMLLKMCQTG